jgi:Fibronectin type III domain
VLRNILIVIGAILALNVLLVGGLAMSNWLDASRQRREIRELESIWRAQRRGAREVPRAGHTRLAGVAFVTVLLAATTTLASPQGRGALTSAIGVVTRGLHPQRVEQAAAPVTDGSLSQDGPGTNRRAPKTSKDTRDGVVGPDATPARASAVASTPPSAGQAAPSTPTAVTMVTAVSISPRQVRVRWADVPRESGYRVERSLNGVTGWAPVAKVSRDATSAVDTGLVADTTYYYRVIATNLGGDSSASSVASATTSVVPATPTPLTAVALSSSQVELDWTNVGNETGYRVERMLVGDPGWTTLATTGQDVTQFIDVGLTGGTTYYYRVIATNASGESAPTEAVSAATSTAPAGDPQATTAPPVSP